MYVKIIYFPDSEYINNESQVLACRLVCTNRIKIFRFITSLILMPSFALCFLFRLTDEEELELIKTEQIVELMEDWENVGYVMHDVTGIALAGCPSAKDVARVATQKSIDKQDHSESEEEEEEEESTEEEDEEEEDPKAVAEKRAQREIKLLISKIKSFK